MAVAIGCAASGARAADDEDEALPDQKLFQGILGIFGARKEEKIIDYRERSPLVLPSSKNLPAPEPSIEPAKKIANWPDDPDLKKAKKKKQLERDRKPYVEGVDDRPLLPSQVNGGVPASPSSGNQGSSPSIDETSRPSSLTELGSKSIFRPGGSPARTPPHSPASRRARACSTRHADIARPRRISRSASGKKEWKPTALDPSLRSDAVK